jgi:hypothetical protein
LLLLLALVASLAPAVAQAPPPAGSGPAQAAKPAQIDRNGVLILIRSTLLAVHDANITGNYTVLRDLGAPGFQATNTAARLSEIFASHRSQNLDLSAVAVLDPQLTLLPQVEPNGLMRMTGFFPSVPLQVNFDFLFAPVAGKWRLFGISINVANSTPSAPNATEVKPPPDVPPARVPELPPQATNTPAPQPAAKPRTAKPARPTPPKRSPARAPEPEAPADAE